MFSLTCNLHFWQDDRDLLKMLHGDGTDIESYITESFKTVACLPLKLLNNNNNNNNNNNSVTLNFFPQLLSDKGHTSGR